MKTAIALSIAATTVLGIEQRIGCNGRRKSVRILRFSVSRAWCPQYVVNSRITRIMANCRFVLHSPET